MGGCQNCGPLLGPLNTGCRIILRTQKGSMILTTTHIPQSKNFWLYSAVSVGFYGRDCAFRNWLWSVIPVLRRSV